MIKSVGEAGLDAKVFKTVNDNTSPFNTDDAGPPAPNGG